MDTNINQEKYSIIIEIMKDYADANTSDERDLLFTMLEDSSLDGKYLDAPLRDTLDAMLEAINA